MALEPATPKPQPMPQASPPAPMPQRSPTPEAAPAAGRSRTMMLVYGAVIVAALALGTVATGIVHVPGFDSGAGAPATSVTQQTDVQQVDEGDHTVGGRIATITPDLAKARQLNRTNGVLIVEAYRNSPLELAGVRTNDVVLAIDGVPVNDVVSFATKVRLTPIGQQLALTLDRGGAAENHSVTVSRCMVREGGPGTLRPCQVWTH